MGVRVGVSIGPNVPWPDLVERVRHVASLGVQSAWIPDHIVSWADGAQPRFDCWTVLGGLATLVPGIRLGSLVTHTVYRNPVAIARAAITVDHMSGGRLEFGIGAAGSAYDHRVTGMPSWSVQERMQRFREALEIIDRLLRGEKVSFSGEYYAAEAEFRPLTLQRPRPPLTIAALGPVALKIAARYADRWSSWAGTVQAFATHTILPPDEGLAITRERNDRLDQLAAEMGRDPATIIRSLLAGWPLLSPGTPWASIEAFRDYVGRYREAGINEFIFLYPPDEYFPGAQVEDGIFDRAVSELLAQE